MGTDRETIEEQSSSREQVESATVETTAAPEVDGHMHPLLAEGIVTNQQRDRLVEAERDRRASEARQQTGDVRDQPHRRDDE